MADNKILDYQLALDACAGNALLVDNLFQVFLQQVDAYQQDISRLFKQSNFAALQEKIHKLHGGLQYLGAPALTQLTSELDGHLADFTAQQLETQINQVIIYLEQIKHCKYIK